MKKMALILAFFAIAGSVVFAQQTVYVSAGGGENESGLNEAKPTTFTKALAQAMAGTAKKIIITGTLDVNSGGMNKRTDVVFDIVDSAGDAKRGKALDEIVITGKPGASGAERAVLSAKGSGNSAVWVRNCKIRFEHIDIEGAEGKYGYGVYIPKDAQVTLGPGAVVRNNLNSGIFAANGGTCVIDGGEVNNNSTGVYVEGTAALLDGSIKNNNSPNSGGGVYIAKGGRFAISGGTITGNKSQEAGGGVFVELGGEFEQNGGTITRNTGQGAFSNVYREKGTGNR